ncbi:MAG: 4-hydroxyphenylpyruvate dioxygenase [Thainema sp.]
MDIDHVHFYVKEAEAARYQLVHMLGCRSIATQTTATCHTELFQQNNIAISLSAPLQSQGVVADYLRRHPAGIAEVGLRVRNLDRVVATAIAAGAELITPIQVQTEEQGQLKWAKIRGWGDLVHLLVERQGQTPLMPGFPLATQASAPKLATLSGGELLRIDHAVLNIAQGELHRAVDWYESVLGFQRQREFAIQTPRSGLRSQVLNHPEGSAQIPINEPTSATSQIQEFLDENRGSGIQHVALETNNIVATVEQLRKRGLKFLTVPAAYYQQVEHRVDRALQRVDWSAIAQQEILVDQSEETPEAMLLQIFTQPIFAEPTFFFEIIQRQTVDLAGQQQQAVGFGEGNFQALFEAIEREQQVRQIQQSRSPVG